MNGDIIIYTPFSNDTIFKLVTKHNGLYNTKLVLNIVVKNKIKILSEINILNTNIQINNISLNFDLFGKSHTQYYILKSVIIDNDVIYESNINITLTTCGNKQIDEFEECDGSISW